MRKTLPWAGTALVSVLLLLSAVAKDKKPLEWQEGKLVAQDITIEGDEHHTHFTIESSTRVYVAKRHRDRLDIVVNAPIKFAVSGNTLYLMDAKGKVHDCDLEQEAIK